MFSWAVIVGGASLSASGLSLLFPFELPMFAKTSGLMNAVGIPGLFGGHLNVALAPQEEMQYAQLWHAIVSFGLTAIIFAHIYFGSVGMEGAYSAMSESHVEKQSAHEHHSIWVETAIAGRDGVPGTQNVAPVLPRRSNPTPAE